jgi:hypothetical protein
MRMSEWKRCGKGKRGGRECSGGVKKDEYRPQTLIIYRTIENYLKNNLPHYKKTKPHNEVWERRAVWIKRKKKCGEENTTNKRNK